MSDNVDIGRERGRSLPHYDLSEMFKSFLSTLYERVQNEELPFVPSVFGDSAYHPSPIYTHIPKMDYIAALDLILSGVHTIDKEGLVSQMATRFYYPGKFILMEHQVEIEIMLFEIGHNLNLPLLRTFNGFINSFLNPEELTNEALNGVFSLVCVLCGDKQVYLSNGAPIRIAVYDLTVMSNRYHPCIYGGQGHRYTSYSLDIIAASRSNLVAHYRMMVERRKRVMLREIRPIPGEVVLISKEWDFVWNMKFDKEYAYGHYFWFDRKFQLFKRMLDWEDERVHAIIEHANRQDEAVQGVNNLQI